MTIQDGTELNESDQLYQALHHRLVTTGEWHRLSLLLDQLLLDSHWSTDMAKYASDKAKKMDTLDLDVLVREVGDKGTRSIPKSVQNSLLEQIKEFLDRNVEDA